MRCDKSKIRDDGLRDLARELVADIAALDPSRSKELIGKFLMEIALAIAERDQQEERRQKQAEGIAAAKARGVRFGRPAKPLPDNFDETHRAWRNGQMTLCQAAEACKMPEGTFYSAAIRREQVPLLP